MSLIHAHALAADTCHWYMSLIHAHALAADTCHWFSGTCQWHVSVTCFSDMYQLPVCVHVSVTCISGTDTCTRTGSWYMSLIHAHALVNPHLTDTCHWYMSLYATETCHWYMHTHWQLIHPLHYSSQRSMLEAYQRKTCPPIRIPPLRHWRLNVGVGALPLLSNVPPFRHEVININVITIIIAL